MDLNLRAAFDAILRFGKSRPDTDLPASMVLLLRQGQFQSLDQLRVSAQRAFGRSFAGGKDSQYCVVEAVLFTLMKVGPHTLSFLNYTKPYGEGEFPRRFGATLPKASQRKAWAEHTAWTAVNYVKGGVDIDLEYCVLARLCAEMLDSNCAGVYVPREKALIANDGSLAQELQRMGSSRPILLI